MCRKPDRWMIRSGRYMLHSNCSQGWPNPPALTILERTGSLPRCASSSQPTVRPRSRGSLPRLPPLPVPGLPVPALPVPTTARQQSRYRTRYGTAGDRRPNTAFNAGLRDPQGLHDGLDLSVHKLVDLGEVIVALRIGMQCPNLFAQRMHRLDDGGGIAADLPKRFEKVDFVHSSPPSGYRPHPQMTAQKSGLSACGIAPSSW